jgi:hypothetical protein
VVPVSSGKAFLLHTRAPRKSLRAAISGSSAIHDRNPQKAGGHPHFMAVIHGFNHSLPTGYRM